MSWMRLLPTIAVKFLLNIVYKVFCTLVKVNPQKVTFASYRSEELTGNLKCVWEEIDKTYPNYQKHVILKKFQGSILGKIGYFTHLIRAAYHLATSAYFFVDDFYFLVYIVKPRKETEVIQLWHAAGALKKFGYSTVGTEFGPSKRYLKHVDIHSNYAKAFVSSSEVIPYYSEAFNMSPEKIFPLGIPRTDILLSEDFQKSVRKRFFEVYPHTENKKIVLFAPTYRGSSHYQDNYQLPFDTFNLKRNIEDDYALFIHLHPYMKPGKGLLNTDNSFSHLIQGEFNIQELLVISDILITDYSTVFFDYSLLERPIIFYAKDLLDYIKERDFYYDYLELIPGPFLTTESDLIDCLKNNKFDVRKVSSFKKRFFEYSDGKATERIVRKVMASNKEAERIKVNVY